MEAPPRVLFCRCATDDALDPGVRDEVQRALAEIPAPVTVVDDLCGLAAGADALLAEIAAAPRSIIVACHRRAVKSLFAFAGAPLDGKHTTFLNMRTQSAGEIRQALAAINATVSGGKNQIDTIPHTSDWVPWFPVIDADRCANCKQCMNFCLFGVFRLSDDGQVEVISPESCKLHCPACARICPEAAIVFPKYGQSPFNGDEVPADQKGPQANMKALITDDIFRVLRDRGGRGVMERPPTAGAAGAQADLHPDLANALAALRKTGPEGCACERTRDPGDPDAPPGAEKG